MHQLQWYFSAAQVEQIVEVIPKGRLQRGQVEALVTVFSRVTDLENLRFDNVLAFKGDRQCPDGHTCQLPHPPARPL